MGAGVLMDVTTYHKYNIPSYLREHTSIVHTYNHTYIISFYIVGVGWGTFLEFPSLNYF